eukprot:XP_019919923.1 PREDICTED: tripartite motif-containing protein 2-like [Crassostrea gigas]
MDPRRRAQDVLRCHICDTHTSLHCEICQIHLCKACVGDHLSDESKDHKVVPIKKRESTPTCSKHSSKQCVIHCEQCDIPICVQCISSGEHEQHKKVDILNSFEKKKEVLQRDLEELEKIIYPQYQDIISKIQTEKVDISIHFEKQRTEIKKHGDDWHREIDTITKKLTTDVNSMESNSLAVLCGEEINITCIMSEITQFITDLQTVLESNDVSFTFAYKSRNSDFKEMHPLRKSATPRGIFTPQNIEKEHIYQQFGSLLLSDEHGFAVMFASHDFSPNKRPGTEKPRIIREIKTEHEEINRLYSVCCQSDQEVWTSSNDHIMRHFNLQGELVKSIKTKSGNKPKDIAITKKGYLAYTDYIVQTLNIVKEKQIQEIKLRKWRPHGVCTTSSGDLLVIMDSDNNRESKVVRYCSSKGKEKQSVQFDTNGLPLYSPGGIKYINENRNEDICVSICWASAVVVVSRVGKFRFSYNGPSTTATRSFNPYGITTDSQGRILTADCNNHSIHILDQDGQFIRYIDNCNICCPYGLCVDTNDNLFVAEWKSGKMKLIQNYVF